MCTLWGIKKGFKKKEGEAILVSLEGPLDLRKITERVLSTLTVCLGHCRNSIKRGKSEKLTSSTTPTVFDQKMNQTVLTAQYQNDRFNFWPFFRIGILKCFFFVNFYSETQNPLGFFLILKVITENPCMNFWKGNTFTFYFLIFCHFREYQKFSRNCRKLIDRQKFGISGNSNNDTVRGR